MHASDRSARLAQLLAAGALSVALLLLAARFEQPAEEAFEAPIMANAAAIAAGLVLAALILAGMRRADRN